MGRTQKRAGWVLAGADCGPSGQRILRRRRGRAALHGLAGAARRGQLDPAISMEAVEEIAAGALGQFPIEATPAHQLADALGQRYPGDVRTISDDALDAPAPTAVEGDAAVADGLIGGRWTGRGS